MPSVVLDIFWSLSNYYILQLTMIMTLIRLHGCTGANVFSRVTKSGFLAAHIVENKPNDINIRPICFAFTLYMYICETPKRVFFFCKQRRPR